MALEYVSVNENGRRHSPAGLVHREATVPYGDTMILRNRLRRFVTLDGFYERTEISRLQHGIIFARKFYSRHG